MQYCIPYFYLFKLPARVLKDKSLDLTAEGPTRSDVRWGVSGI